MLQFQGILVGGVLAFVFLIVCVAALFFWLWKQKSAEDRKAFSDTMKTTTVNTVYDPSEYKEAVRVKNTPKTPE